MKAGFEFIEHAADIKMRTYGPRIESVFVEAVHAFCAYVTKGKRIQKDKRKEFTLESADKQELLYTFLDELVYLLDAEDFIVADAAVIIKDNNLKAVLYGDAASNYRELSHVKAATYAEIYVKQVKEGWEAQAVLDV